MVKCTLYTVITKFSVSGREEALRGNPAIAQVTFLGHRSKHTRSNKQAYANLVFLKNFDICT